MLVASFPPTVAKEIVLKRTVIPQKNCVSRDNLTCSEFVHLIQADSKERMQAGMQEWS